MIPSQENTPEKKNELSRVESVYRQLKKSILFNEFPPGYQELEPDLAERLGVSRTPMREALIRLASEKLIELVPRRGMRIKPLIKADLDEMLDILIALERLVIHLLGLDSTLDQKALHEELTLLLQAESEKDVNSWIESEARLKMLIVKASGSDRLAVMIQNLRDQLTRAQKSRIDKNVVTIDELMAHVNSQVGAAKSGDWLEYRRHSDAYFARLRADVDAMLLTQEAI